MLLQPDDVKILNDSYSYKKVKEDDTCQHWECVAGNVLAPMHECWYCKYSDFRKDISNHLAHSVCYCPANISLGKEKKL